MKIKFSDHLTGGVTQEPLRAINPSTAPLRLVAELQMETGWDLKTFRANGATMYTFAMSAWLTLHNAGFTTITWDDAVDLAMDDMEFIEEPGDRVAAGMTDEQTEEDASEPASPGSSPAGEPATPPRAATRSKTPNRGSRAKSANGSRTS